MTFANFENFILNLNFLLLFLTLIFYFLQLTLLISSKWSFLPNSGLKISNVLQASFLGLRWYTSGHFPLSNLYESLLFLSWVLTNCLIILNFRIGNRFITKQTKSQANLNDSSNLIYSFLGSLLTPLILLINTFASFGLPTELKLTSSLVPALKSNWLMMHVTFMVLSYGALLCGCLLAIAFLLIPVFLSLGNKIWFLNFYAKQTILPKIQNDTKSLNLLTFKNENLTKYSEIVSKPDLISNFGENQDEFKLTQVGSNYFSSHPPNFHENQILKETSFHFVPSSKKYDDFLENLDNLSYRIIGFGFPLLTIGILSGAVWANKTWGSYWSWDPKETWAFITWLVFAIYLHSRFSRGWSGQQSAFIAAFGFIVIWVCYLGVNLLGKGLHSYGFFNPF